MIFEYTAAQLHASPSAPATAFQAYPPTECTGCGSNAIEFPTGIAFDASGVLYTSYTDQSFKIYPPAAYASANPAPTATISSTTSVPIYPFLLTGPAYTDFAPSR